MIIFLSYASEQRDVAEQIKLALTVSGHKVFFDRDSLPAGDDYHMRIRNAVEDSEAFVFLISPQSVARGCYALTELKYAREKWPDPRWKVLPVIVERTEYHYIPPYLKAISVLEPEGSAPAEVAAELQKWGANSVPLPEPQSGTWTFLFTDVEDSAGLWNRHADSMRSALARHDAILSEAIAQHGGKVFKRMGDAFCAAFATALDALAAAVRAQLTLQNEPWERVEPIRVRMALDSGEAEWRDDDYFGQPLKRVARLLSVAYGGQILLSASARELGRGHLLPGVTQSLQVRPVGALFVLHFQWITALEERSWNLLGSIST